MDPFEKSLKMLRTPVAEKADKNEKCTICKKDHNDEMVVCDRCGQWYHYLCVGVDKTIETSDDPWFCGRCEEILRGIENFILENRDELTTGIIQHNISTKHNSGDNDNGITQLPNNPVEPGSSSKSDNKVMPKSVGSKQNQAKRKIFPVGDSGSPGLQHRKLKEIERLEEELKCRMSFIDKKYAALDESRYDCSSDEQETEGEHSRHVIQHYRVARQTYGEELPIFSGSILEWPLFIMNFEESTRLCGYNNWENRKRLDKCLKPPARDLVRCLLIFPKNVPQIISTLRLKYGNPQMVVNSMINQVDNIAPVPRDNMERLIDFSISVNNLCSMIEACEQEAHYDNPVFLQRLVCKLPIDMRRRWTIYKNQERFGKKINMLTFNEWLSGESIIANETIGDSNVVLMSTQTKSRTDTRPANALNRINKQTGQVFTHIEQHASNRPTSRCMMCNNEEHGIDKCTEFINLELKKRWELAYAKKLCWICLKRHYPARCLRKQLCGIDGCTRKHHQLLHGRESAKPNTSTTPNDLANPITSVESCHTHQQQHKSILFKILPVTLFGPKATVDTYAFLDDGSSITLLENKTADILGLEGPRENLCLLWTSDATRQEENSKRVCLSITGQNGKKYPLDDVRTVDNLGLPVQNVESRKMQQYQHLDDIKVQWYKNAQPTILIGIDQVTLNVPLDVREGSVGEPSAIRTRLGWVIFGPLSKTPISPVLHHRVSRCCSQAQDDKVDQLVKSYFTLESVGVDSKIPESNDDMRARSIMESTSKRIDELGRYEIGLLWRFEKIELPDSYFMALKRLTCVENKMRRDPKLYENLCTQFREYTQNGYARKLTHAESSQISPKTWFLPTFAVSNPLKPNKVRVVWDAAAQVKGISLNDMLLKGPDLLCTLTDVLHRFRQFKVAVTGDIQHMFHQVKIRQEDQDSQRFLWRDGDTSRKPDQYVMMVMTFGASCSPSCAQYIKNKNAETFRQQLPRATEAIVSSHYVDDFLDSVDSTEEAIKLAEEVKLIHRHGGFHIRNWLSNDRKVRQVLGGNEINQKEFAESGDSEKILGMWWNTVDDTFRYRISYHKVDKAIISGERSPTKRELLRCLMSIFDPLGLMAHLLAPMKILLQDVWRSGVGWDDVIPDELLSRWQDWLVLINQISNISVPRWYQLSPSFKQEVQLHLFSDASENVYATVAYFRILTGNNVSVSLIGAKTKVAPLHPISIPRLELQAAVLSARFSKKIVESHTQKIASITYWSDSEVVLRWLNSDHRKYRQYVAVRIGEIIESTNINDWRWVPTKANVADDATKRTPHVRLDSNSRWFSGPPFLYENPSTWPLNKIREKTAPDEELRPHHVHRVAINPISAIPDPKRFEYWRVFVRTLAYAQRFIQILKLKTGEFNNQHFGSDVQATIPPLVRKEIEKAENTIYRYVQWECFPEEMAQLTNKSDVVIQKSSMLRKLSPYIDENGVLRHKGRIDAAYGVSYETKRPILLHAKHRVTTMIIAMFHRRYHHSNNETVINEIRQQFYILKVRTALKKLKSSCQWCKIARAKPTPPEMGNLPSARLASFTRPFTYTGMDFFGPMQVKVGRRIEKRWGVIFTCLTIRAVHLELANSLSSDECIICIRNFIARRGRPNQMYSDNGTNLKGADIELRKALNDMNWDKTITEFDRIDWKFIPPHSPHMGGAWERLIQSVKKTLRTTLPTRRPTDSLLRSMLIEAESVINTRPLTHIAVDPDEPTALTPNHFLLGESSGTKPPGVFSDKDLLLRKNWRISQRFTDMFWNRWVKDYLPTISRREKWHEKIPPIKIGDLVMICDEGERNSWQRGVVQQVNAGNDGQVRSVIVHTQKGLYNRPSVKVAVLDVGKTPSQGIYGGTVVNANDPNFKCSAANTDI